MRRTWNREDSRELDRAVRTPLDAGDERAAIALLVERIGPSIRAYLRTLLLEDEAEEAYSDFLENVTRSLSSFRWECPVRAWAYRLAYHAAARIWRRPARRIEEPLPSSLSRLGPGSGRPEPVMSSRHAGLALLRASLSVEDQTLLTLRIDRELEWEEVAAVLEDGADGPSAPRAAALRKRYERLTTRLREEALRHGLID
jgi:RNA polymerase sigma-70 factor (ECF subfamily)